MYGRLSPQASVGSDSTLAFFRHAEIKHGRVAMAAIVGLLVHINGIHFSGSLSPTYGVTFEALSKMGPFEAWNAIPLLGQAQILWTIAGLEHASECLDPAGHYTKGGTPGNLKFLKVRVSRGNRISLFCAHCFMPFALTLPFAVLSLTHRTSGTLLASPRSSPPRSSPRSVSPSSRTGGSR